MNNAKKKFLPQSNTRTGAMLPLLSVTIVILFVACVLAIDIARIHVTRSELRTATDAAARAGVEALGREQNVQAAIDAALAVAQQNVVAGNGLTLSPDNILFGKAVRNNEGVFEFTEINLANVPPFDSANRHPPEMEPDQDGSNGRMIRPVWSEDGDYFYLLSPQGTLRKTDC